MMAPGSTASFEAFYRSQNRCLFHFFRRRAGCDAAADLVQEVFARMLCADVFERLDNPRAYMFSAARNLLIERSRRKARKARLFPLDEGRDAPVCPEQTYSIEAADLRRTLRRTILAMPRRTRRIFLMHRLRSQTYREIANEVGIGEQGVEYHMMRALARCRTAVASQ
ncbi:RNA polymerase sigma-70 factor (ECF subfamily) [Sphingopyxis sp. OAS728]|uniref:RNA polymerase sigma factor n=1 Tax=Sphingopyxis sp. OAS728 TaxID=2663823 RepID=UPI0019D80989|nr:sigma-70 family RNA polymerase sigma factor [Sphingopyxis sp. OAS728]MBE1526853.1 RNA polymerase sigma-70 factor (ECF subfamily) [Sphingopyxis sp. OAS728]